MLIILLIPLGVVSLQELDLFDSTMRIYINLCVFTTTLLFITIKETTGKQIFKLEAENYWKSFIYRQSASQDKTVSLNENDAMSLPFCLRRTTTVAVNNVLYTNDGLPNIIAISIDSVSVGELVSHNRSERGKLWNVVSSTGQIGEHFLLPAGPHKIHLHIRPTSEDKRTDPFGIEIDAVFLEIDDMDISGHYLHCFNTLCSDKITYSDRHVGRDDIPSGRIVQMSRPSNCLEEDNIKVRYIHRNIIINTNNNNKNNDNDNAVIMLMIIIIMSCLPIYSVVIISE